MRTNNSWRKHLHDLVNASLDPLVYAVQWAQDPRCLQHGVRHGRIGSFVERNRVVCRLWAGKLPSGRTNSWM